MQIHSRAKVDFYKTYLERYVSILCQSQYIKHIRIYDVFCGMGIYEDGGKGSPIVAYDTIKGIYDARLIANNTQITLTVNDISPKRISKVCEYTDSHKHPYCVVRPFNLDLEAKIENARKLKGILETALKLPQTNKDIYELVVRNEFLPKHANEVLKELQNTNSKFKVVDYRTGKNARKNAFYLSYKQYNSEPVVKMQIES